MQRPVTTNGLALAGVVLIALGLFACRRSGEARPADSPTAGSETPSQQLPPSAAAGDAALQQLPPSARDDWPTRHGAVALDECREGFSTPLAGRSGDPAVQIVAGRTHSCARHKSGAVTCWGLYEVEDVGMESAGLRPPKAVPTPPLADAVALSSGPSNVCARLRDGSVTCWGASTGDRAVTVRFAIDDASDVAVGRDDVCVLRLDGRVTCNVLGDQVDVEGLAPASAIAAGEADFCAITKQGEVACWGQCQAWKNDGRLVPEAWHKARPVPGVSGAKTLSLGEDFGCALSKGGQVRCWSLSRGCVALSWRDETAGVPPFKVVPISGVGGAVDVAASDTFASVLSKDGRVTVFGYMDSFMWAVVVPESPNGAPAKVVGLGNVASIARGPEIACGLQRNGRIGCYGEIREGEMLWINDWVQRGRNEAVLIPGLTHVQQLAIGFAHTCALTSSGEVRCWGSNRWGQLGEQGTAGRCPDPVSISDE